MRSRICAVALVLAVLAPATVSYAQSETLLNWANSEETGGPPGFDEPLASDRPDFTEASTTVGKDVRQLELGYTYFSDRSDGVTRASHSFPEALLRVGALHEWLELRVGLNCGSLPLLLDSQAMGSVTGVDDLYLGAKFGLTPQAGFLPEMALVPQCTIPTGSAGFTSGRTLPGLNWLYGWDISDWISTAGSTQGNVAVDDESDREYLEFAQSWTIGYTLSEKLGAYTEWFMLTPVGANSVRTEHYLDGGFTYRVTNNLQLDIRAGKGLSSAAQDMFSGAGLVVRW